MSLTAIAVGATWRCGGGSWSDDFGCSPRWPRGPRVLIRPGWPPKKGLRLQKFGVALRLQPTSFSSSARNYFVLDSGLRPPTSMGLPYLHCCSPFCIPTPSSAQSRRSNGFQRPSGRRLPPFHDLTCCSGSPPYILTNLSQKK